ncbi:family 43 glycosylhydrolase [Dietzia sp. B32]|uniref:family 43 glycosylhydrolase n=1 Tax=Dietzia sp. B32 TaxID=2915130 RepID=UPI0021AD8D19|nr:family 43 glycosylhydrolase [Dietzia sp. B32]UVE95270.1 family 43 glycosylhydrolase [Dietzia sp. B32]
MKPAAAARALVSAALVVVVPIASATLAATAAANPVISSVAPDPSVQRGADGAFHVHATSDDWGDGAGRRLIPHFRSFDLVEWEYVGDAFAAPPAWAPSGSFLWAPDVHLTATGAVMYYTTGGPAPCIGRATAPDIGGPWAHDPAPIVCHGAPEPYQDLDPMDPEVVVTDAGPVMLMGNFEGIHAVPMNATGTALDGDPVLVAGTGVEAPAVVTRQGRTHLFTSAGLCCDGEASQYRVLGGRADGLFGPYEDRAGRPLVQAPGEPLPGDVILRGDADWVGPGHVDVATDDAGRDWMLYHAAPRGSAVLPSGVQRRYMMLDRLDWVGGWPVVGDGTPSESRPTDPVVALPVRLTAVGEASLRQGDDGEVLDLSVRVASTGSAYSGEVRVTITGPDKRRLELPIVTDAGDLPAVPVSVGAGASVDRPLTLRPAAPLAPGRHELVVSIGAVGGAAQELAVFGLEVAPDGSLSLGSGALGSVPIGSSGS